ncbi:MAG: pilus assembly protein PilP [Bdellovibrionaceae bacterium]|nr:pilus assembly protein PilP [Pseudobdellovibrionaceae bacterium]
MKSVRWIVTYIVAASIGLWFALFLSLKLVSTARAQQPPPAPVSQAPQNGDLPPEFQDSTATGSAIPPAPTEPPPNAQTTPPTSDASAPPVSPAAAAPAPAAPAVNEISPSVPATADQIPPMDSGAVPLIPQFATDDQYHYDPTGRRDPFQPYRKYRPAPSTIKIDLSDPLQRWDIARFEIVAVMWEVRNPRAMVKDPDGKIYMLQKTTKIGRNGGQVVAIREGEVVVVESIETEGVVTKEVKILELKK